MLTYHAQRYTIQLSQLMFPGWLSNKASACQAGDAGDMGSIPGSGGSPREGNGSPVLLFLPRKSHRQSPAGYCPWGHTDSDTAWQLNNK